MKRCWCFSVLYFNTCISYFLHLLFNVSDTKLYIYMEIYFQDSLFIHYYYSYFTKKSWQRELLQKFDSHKTFLKIVFKRNFLSKELNNVILKSCPTIDVMPIKFMLMNDYIWLVTMVTVIHLGYIPFDDGHVLIAFWLNKTSLNTTCVLLLYWTFLQSP